MNSYKEIDGNLITLATQGMFDVITHGCNCFCTMGAGIAVPMKQTFGCDSFELESPKYKGDINKLGQIDYKGFKLDNNRPYVFTHGYGRPDLYVVNSYTQYRYGRNHKDGVSKPIDYEALRLCMRKINKEFESSHIGLPKIGAGLAGGNWDVILKIIQSELTTMDVTLINYV